MLALLVQWNAPHSWPALLSLAPLAPADVTNDKIHKDLMEHVIKPVVPEKYLDDNTIFHLNPSGRWVLSA